MGALRMWLWSNCCAFGSSANSCVVDIASTVVLGKSIPLNSSVLRGLSTTIGEGIEQPWSFIGALASSTREMGPGAHHGVLDCQWSYWNWIKLVGLVTLLRRQMDHAEAEYERQKEGLEAAVAAATTVPNPYEVKIKGLTEAQVRLQFSKEEQVEVARGVPSIHDVTPSKFISAGLDVEAEQRRVRLQAELKKAGTTGMQINILAMRTALSRQMVRFRKLQATYTPGTLQALAEMEIVEDVPIENMPLLMPSALMPAQRTTCRPGLANIEDGAVTPASSIAHQVAFLIYKGNHARHQGANTRSQTIVAWNKGKIRLQSEKFQMAWEAIRLLSPDGEPATVGWPKLKADNIHCMEDTERLRRPENCVDHGKDEQVLIESTVRYSRLRQIPFEFTQVVQYYGRLRQVFATSPLGGGL
ncbi:hypothetical protein B0H13DRAFT_2536120 [Mycena leptocephala]|nr:hypothetical protein B0H13DRAFT_2536120 [Mycena leptocephala]